MGGRLCVHACLCYNNYVCDLWLYSIANSMDNYILLTVYMPVHCMFGTIQPMMLGDNLPPSSRSSFGSTSSYGSDAPLLPGIVTSDLLMCIIHL